MHVQVQATLRRAAREKHKMINTHRNRKLGREKARERVKEGEVVVVEGGEVEEAGGENKTLLRWRKQQIQTKT